MKQRPLGLCPAQTVDSMTSPPPTDLPKFQVMQCRHERFDNDPGISSDNRPSGDLLGTGAGAAAAVTEETKTMPQRKSLRLAAS
jgi:hypothetical protein